MVEGRDALLRGIRRGRRQSEAVREQGRLGERALMYPPLRTRSVQMGRYPENQMLSYFEDIVQYQKWYFGHYHMDSPLNDKMTVLYQGIVLLGD